MRRFAGLSPDVEVEEGNSKGAFSDDRKCCTTPAVSVRCPISRTALGIIVPATIKDANRVQHRAEYDYLNPSKLRFDPNNPRFGGILSSKTQDQIEELLIAKPYYASELI